MNTAVFPFPASLFDQASRSELQGLMEVIHYAALAQSSKDVKNVLIRTKELFPFERLIGGLIRFTPDGTFDGFSDVLNVSFPQTWLFQYWKNSYGKVDPVLHELVRSNQTQVWNQVYAKVKTEEENEFLQAAAGYGLVDGVTTGALDASCGVATFFAFAGKTPVRNDRYVQMLSYLGQHLHLALLRAASKSSPSTDNCVTMLSPREVTILNWIKDGKTNGEIGQIIGLTERTVRFHVESIFAKLDVSSRTQAVAVAVQHGLPNLVA